MWYNVSVEEPISTNNVDKSKKTSPRLQPRETDLERIIEEMRVRNIACRCVICVTDVHIAGIFVKSTS